MESQLSGDYKRSIGEQAEGIKEFVKTFEVYMAKDEVALGEICGMMDEIARRVAEINASISVQADTLKQYLASFEKYRSENEQAVTQVRDMMGKLTQRAAEIDTAHKKRILLLGELNKTCRELEDSHVRFAEKFKNGADNKA